MVIVAALSTGEAVFRIGLAAGVGALIGLEREWRQRAAGLRTHALVAAGAALFTMTGAYGFADLAARGGDPMRLAAQVASGIGFVGAGVILRQGQTVRGLTTAATLWASAALGVAAGAGFMPGAISGFAVVVAILLLLRPVAGPLARILPAARHQTVLRLEYERGRGTLGLVLEKLQAAGATVTGLAIDDDGPPPAAGVRRVLVRFDGGDPDVLVDATESLLALPEVSSARLQRVPAERRRGLADAA